MNAQINGIEEELENAFLEYLDKLNFKQIKLSAIKCQEAGFMAEKFIINRNERANVRNRCGVDWGMRFKYACAVVILVK